MHRRIVFITVVTFLLDIENGRIADVYEMGVIEPLSVKMCMISSATEAAEQVFILTRFKFRSKKTSLSCYE